MVYGSILLTLILGTFALVLPEDIILLSAGYLIFTGHADFLPMIGVCLVGVLIGDMSLYGVARLLQHNVGKIPLVRRLFSVERQQKMEQTFRRFGPKTIFFVRFIGGLRAPAFLLAGAIKMPVKQFVLIDMAAACISVPTFVSIGWLFGKNIEAIKEGIVTAESVIFWVIVAAVALFFGVKLVKHIRSKSSGDTEPATDA